MTWQPEPDEHWRLFDSYEVEIVRVADGEVRRRTESQSLFWWTEGNGSCDCNRHICFEGGWADDPRWEFPCGETAYRVVRAIFPDGTEQAIDDPA